MPSQVEAKKTAVKDICMWSASSWTNWKQCPMKFKIKADKWANPRTKPDRRIAVLAVPGLVIDQLFELWLHRGEFDNQEWLADNFLPVWHMVVSKRKPKWTRDEEPDRLKAETWKSVGILYELLHRHDLLNDHMGIQTDFYEQVSDGISIAGAIDLWTFRDDGTLVLVDFKNFQSKRPRSTDQLHFYAMALGKVLGKEPEETGYLCFNPQAAGYRQRALRLCDRNKLWVRLKSATEARRAGEFVAKYNSFYCPRYCEVRFGCPAFLDRCPHLRRR